MGTKEAYMMIHSALDRFNVVNSTLGKSTKIPKEVMEQYRMCGRSLRTMGQLATCLIENCNQTLGAISALEEKRISVSNGSKANRYNK